MVDEQLKQLLNELKQKDKNGNADRHEENSSLPQEDKQVKPAPNFDRDRSFERDGMISYI